MWELTSTLLYEVLWKIGVGVILGSEDNVLKVELAKKKDLRK